MFPQSTSPLPSGKRRQLLLSGYAVFATTALGVGSWTQAKMPNLLPVATSLRLSLYKAVAMQQPLVVMVSLPGCPFCKIARENYLIPMLQQEGRPVVQIDMLGKLPVQDFNNQATTHGKMVSAWGIKVAPTILFFGKNGQEVANRLEGASIPDFYGQYLEDRLVQARGAVL